MSTITEPHEAVMEIEETQSVPCVGPAEARRYATLTFTRGALVALATALMAGSLAVFYYVPGVGEMLAAQGINFTTLRPVHTTFAAIWIFLGGLAAVHRYMQDHGGPMRRAERIRVGVQISLWALAGVGILITLGAGIFSGREYMGFHPAFSLAILGGWLLFAWNFFRVVGPGFWRKPVYITMWGVGTIFFIVTFAEQHLWLLQGVFADPIMDVRIQWKANGTLVGSFNLFVYGSLIYLGEKISGDDRYGHSRMAYALFGVGLLNSFTNYGHHTYHLPQSAWVNWISFLVSMAEIVILWRVVVDIARTVKRRGPAAPNATKTFLTAAKWWTGMMLFSALLISIPPLNALIHGTHAVMGHAMGAEIGIDSMALFAVVCFILCERFTRCPHICEILNSRHARMMIIVLNAAAACLVLWLHAMGVAIGINRYQGMSPPGWIVTVGPFVFLIAGMATAGCLSVLLGVWIYMAFSRFRRLEQA